MGVIAVTGGIAVGKSVMMQYWRSRYSPPIFDMDDIGRELLHEDVIKREVFHIFGAEAMAQNGCVDRVFVQKRIFSFADEKKALERLLHPYIREEAKKRIDVYLKNSPYCLVIVPLLFETKTAKNYDRVCVVESALDQRVRRCFDRGFSESVILAIMQSQASSEDRISISDDVLYNLKDFTFFYEQIDRLYTQYELLFAKQ